MIHITLPDGSIRSYEEQLTVMDVAKDISEGFARNVISASFNNHVVETSTVLNTDGKLVLYTWRDSEGKKAFWHSSSHVLAQALEELYPRGRITIVTYFLFPKIQSTGEFSVNTNVSSFNDALFEGGFF